MFGGDDVRFVVSGDDGVEVAGDVDVFARAGGASRIRVTHSESAGAPAIAGNTIDMTAGNIEIAGILLARQSMFLGATSQILVSTPSGAVRVLDDEGLPAGSLTLNADDIWVGSPELLGQLAANQNFAGRDAALTNAGGAPSPRDFVEGGSVSFFVGDSLLVQNVGTATNFAGITVGSGLAIVATGADPVTVFAFARRRNADGSFVEGDDFFAEVNIDPGEALFTGESRIGACSLTTGCPVVIQPEDPDPVIPPLPADVAQGPVSDDSSAGAASSEESIGIDIRQELVDVTALASESLIEEPVTSGSDSLLWIAEDDDEDEEDEDEENEGVQGRPAPASGGNR